MKESFVRSHNVKKEKPTKSPREPPKLETKVRKSITSTWNLYEHVVESHAKHGSNCEVFTGTTSLRMVALSVPMPKNIPKVMKGCFFWSLILIRSSSAFL